MKIVISSEIEQGNVPLFIEICISSSKPCLLLVLARLCFRLFWLLEYLLFDGPVSISFADVQNFASKHMPH
jgi:hypothetical protein